MISNPALNKVKRHKQIKTYSQIKKNIASGWNTWNTRSILSHVFLPDGLALDIGVKEYSRGEILREALIGRKDIPNPELVSPGLRSYDGSYTEIKIEWMGNIFEVRTAADADDIVILVTPLEISGGYKKTLLFFNAAYLWNRPGTVKIRNDALVAKSAGREVSFFFDAGQIMEEPYLDMRTPSLSFEFTREAGVSSGRKRTVAGIRRILDAARDKEISRAGRFAEFADVYRAIQTCIAWDTVYEPSKDRVVTGVSRLWNCFSGSYVLFCWDTYFAALLAAIDNKELAYANAIEITNEITESGFVPNVSSGNGYKTLDRSQPPVGARMVLEIYRRHGGKWFLREVFENLIRWNRWWSEKRDCDGLLCWGSNDYGNFPDKVNKLKQGKINTRFGAALESGLDNSPMYDEIPFDKENGILRLADAGLNGLYVMDCDALAEIAAVLGKKKIGEELSARAEKYRKNLQRLWCDKAGIFLNRRTDTGEFDKRISPTNFYPLIGNAASIGQAQRMITEHFYNENEFWGEWIMPSISRDNPAFVEQDYWRGRIWPPMNFLVYLGLKNYNLGDSVNDISEKSATLLLKEWVECRHVHENYCAITGEGCNKPNSDRFYNWGGLMGIMKLMENKL